MPVLAGGGACLTRDQCTCTVPSLSIQPLTLTCMLIAQGDLFDDVKRRGGRLPEREVVTHVLHPYLTALAYLHARGIIHR